MGERYVLFLRRFHIWTEDFNRFILKIEETGFLGAWGTIPLLADISVNPNIENYKKPEDFQLEIYMFIPFIILLSIGLIIAKFAFLCEIIINPINTLSEFIFSYSSFQRLKCQCKFIKKLKRKKISFIFGIFLCLIAIILSLISYFAKDETEFPAVVGKLGFLS